MLPSFQSHFDPLLQHNGLLSKYSSSAFNILSFFDAELLQMHVCKLKLNIEMWVASDIRDSDVCIRLELHTNTVLNPWPVSSCLFNSRSGPLRQINCSNPACNQSVFCLHQIWGLSFVCVCVDCKLKALVNEVWPWVFRRAHKPFVNHDQ